ncbi:MAG: hypothetical protein ABIN91_11130 [Mucilaginibacter sp.]|uniref:hypothetical protein n=1 Tax=Mucilaginibacter sp. TaxID=1882438 RepID=UPI0032634CBC
MNLLKKLWNKLTGKQKMEAIKEELSEYAKEKQAGYDKYELELAYNNSGQKKIRKPAHGTNYTPPKKKRKK